MHAHTDTNTYTKHNGCDG